MPKAKRCAVTYYYVYTCGHIHLQPFDNSSSMAVLLHLPILGNEVLINNNDAAPVECGNDRLGGGVCTCVSAYAGRAWIRETGREETSTRRKKGTAHRYEIKYRDTLVEYIPVSWLENWSTTFCLSMACIQQAQTCNNIIRIDGNHCSYISYLHPNNRLRS